MKEILDDFDFDKKPKEDSVYKKFGFASLMVAGFLVFVYGSEMLFPINLSEEIWLIFATLFSFLICVITFLGVFEFFRDNQSISSAKRLIGFFGNFMFLAFFGYGFYQSIFDLFNLFLK